MEIFDQVRIVVAEGNPRLSSAIVRVLEERGLTSVATVATVDALAEALASAFVDLITCDSQLPGGDLPDLLQRMRHRNLGHNPFAGVIATVRGADAQYERRLAEAGPDTILLKPLTMEALLDAVTNLVKERRRFVVTEGYVGPPRRTGARADETTEPPTMMDVPNTLKMRIRDKVSDGEVTGQVSSVSRQLSAKQFDATAAEINRLVAHVADYYAGTEPNEADWRETLNRFVTLSMDLFKRQQRLGNDAIASLARLLHTLGERILARPPIKRGIEVDLLINVNQAVQLALSEQKGEDTMVVIAGLVARFTEKEAARK